MSNESASPSPPATRPQARTVTFTARLVRVMLALCSLLVAGSLALACGLTIALTIAYPNLPDVQNLLDYRPKLPLRVLSADGQLIGEFGEERRNLLTIQEIPDVMKHAVLAIEDARFFEHRGVDYRGMVRAALANLGQAKSQGASTITMQLARNVYLTAEKSYTRKIYEILLTFKLEHLLTKEQILEIYMNQIFLGQRAYGFAAASQIYFGKPLQDISVAEAAMLAGLPKAPSAYNPISNPRRARQRQLHIIDRMLENGYITPAQATQAREEPLRLRAQSTQIRTHAEHAAEIVRQAVVAQYGEEAYTRGLVVTTTLDSRHQRAAHSAVRRGLLDFERRQFYRGPERFINLPDDLSTRDELIDDTLAEHPDFEDWLAAIVLEASPRRVVVTRQEGAPIEITGEGLRTVQSGLSERASPNVRIRPGAVVRIHTLGANAWQITQLPEVEAALVSMDTQTGAIRAMVGGFDFNRNKFNNVTQAWRQPGSSFKPFIYSAALEKGVSPQTVVNDAPLFYSATQTGGKPWEPKNYDGKFDGPMTVRKALAVSKNMVSIQLLQVVGTQSAQQWIERFGFDASRNPPYLTMALGAGAVTPLQMAAGYAVFANEGHRVDPILISRIADHRGKILFEAEVPPLDESKRVIDARNAYVMNSLLQEVTRSGTASRAQSTLKRSDLYGKTGTTNDAVDAWFVGFQPRLVAATWVGYATPRNLGSRETGGGLSLPIWIQYMNEALKDVPVQEYATPPGLVSVGGDWYYEEFGPNEGVRSLGLHLGRNESTSTGDHEPSPTPQDGSTDLLQERKRILDMFKN